MASDTDRNGGAGSPEDRSLDSLPPELRLYVPAEGTPVESAKPDEPSYEKVPLASLSGAARPEPAPAAEVPPQRAKDVGLPSKVSLISLAAAAVILVSVPFVLAVLFSGDDETPGMIKDGVPIDAVEAIPAHEGAGDPVPAPPAQPELTTGNDVPPAQGEEPAESGKDPLPQQDQPKASGPSGGGDTLIAGAGCSNTATEQYQAVGYHTNGSKGWYIRNGGAADGRCRGTFDAMPMSGDLDTSGPDNSAKWTFDVSGKVTTGTCALSVYIPNDSNRRNVGATKAHYSIFNSFEQGAANVIGVRDINQVTNLGRWVDLGSYKITQGKISVKLHDRGEDYAGGADGEGAHIASTQVRATCTPA
ncbi:hypothetical protein SAMN05216215_104953 [Saccharopolyspora shandongensis]|uniref:Golvesin/Xly CBD-like domain-containing protein n=1 Tax=Saccharopolyspora shandongensis TaxID=418495 RepID=A0A1H3QTH6_9PSEU|nr:hypothetical protein [Saccharopolyspora shandongensis]SDZ16308.1 hypothetical protein SAMN05216215_104953 [Saccharopolyspora shandongensis]